MFRLRLLMAHTQAPLKRPSSIANPMRPANGRKHRAVAEFGFFVRDTISQESKLAHCQTGQSLTLLSTRHLLGNGRGVLGLLFVRRFFEECNSNQRNYSYDRGHKNGSSCRQVTHQNCERSGERSNQIHPENSSALPEPKIGQPVRRVIFARGRKRNQASPTSGNSHKRRIKNSCAQDKNRRKPRGEM